MVNAPSQTRDQAYYASMPTHETQSQKLLRLIREAGAKGITRQKLMDDSGLPINVVTARIRPMIDAGVIEKHGQVDGEFGAPREVLIAQEFAEQRPGDIESRIEAVVEFVEGEKTPHCGVNTTFMLHELQKLSRTNKLWPAGTRMQWEDAIAAAVKRGLLVHRDNETVWLPVKAAEEKQDAPKQLELF